jgi:hypothetical protein
MPKPVLLALVLTSVLLTHDSLSAETVEYSFDELLSQPRAEIKLEPYGLGFSFASISKFEFDLAGAATRHTWERWDLNGGFQAYETSDLWTLGLYRPGYATPVVSSFNSSGAFDLNLTASRNGDWSEMESGFFSLRPAPSGVHVGTTYHKLVESTAQITLSEMKLRVTGTGAPSDSDLDGDVDGSDFLHYQRSGPGDIWLWRIRFVQLAPIAPTTMAPEPNGIPLILLAACALTSAYRSELMRRNVAAGGAPKGLPFRRPI